MISSLLWSRLGRIPVKIRQLFDWIAQSIRYQALKWANKRHNDAEVLFVCMTLDGSGREHIFEKNQLRIPSLRKFRSVNGYDKHETIAALKRSWLTFHSLDSTHATYGTLACYLTKFFALEEQIETQTPFLCLIEDDMEVLPDFTSFVQNLTRIFRDTRRPINVVRLGEWGEGYLFSLPAAINVVQFLRKDGICLNIDNTLRLRCGLEASFERLTPWRRLVETNQGDIMKTHPLEKNFHDIPQGQN